MRAGLRIAVAVLLVASGWAAWVILRPDPSYGSVEEVADRLRSEGIECRDPWTDGTGGGDEVESGGCVLIGEPGLFGEDEVPVAITIYRSDRFQEDLPEGDPDGDCPVVALFGDNWTVVAFGDPELHERLTAALGGSSRCAA